MPIAHQVIDQRDMCFADSTNRKHSGGSRTGYLFSGLSVGPSQRNYPNSALSGPSLGIMFW